MRRGGLGVALNKAVPWPAARTACFEEASDELRYRQGHGLVQIAIFGAVVLPFEDDLLVVEGDQAAV